MKSISPLVVNSWILL